MYFWKSAKVQHKVMGQSSAKVSLNILRQGLNPFALAIETSP
jgi:hypothetical protein